MACKDAWTAEPGSEYMRWMNVEPRPGEGYPPGWEDQDRYRGGWVEDDKDLRLRSGSRLRRLAELFHNPFSPTLETYPEYWRYEYSDPTDSFPPMMAATSSVTTEVIIPGKRRREDFPDQPSEDLLLSRVGSDTTQGTARIYPFDLPRLCNHCLNPACVAACPSGALYKRAEDGIVLVDQQRCRAWKSCIPACPYKKVFYNWRSGKSKKCTFCYPAVERAQAPLCFRSCSAGALLLEPVLYDADRIRETASSDLADLTGRLGKIMPDPCESSVARLAKGNGVTEAVLASVRASLVYRAVIEWQVALPLHPEYRTLPMVFYTPPLSPILKAGKKTSPNGTRSPVELLEEGEMAVNFLSQLFSAGRSSEVYRAVERMLAVRAYRKGCLEGGAAEARSRRWLQASGLTPAQADDIFHYFSLASRGERLVFLQEQ
jgi:nitrate reductase beta subunit